MAANVESMFYTGAEPWHGLGEKLEDAPTISEAIEKSGLDWEVGVKDLVTKDGLHGKVQQARESFPSQVSRVPVLPCSLLCTLS